MQHRGLQFRHVERDAYRAELRHVEGHGDYWLLHQQSKPHVVAHVQLPKTEAEFDNILGWCLGQNHWCEYIEGDFSFLCVIDGSQLHKRNPAKFFGMEWMSDCTVEDGAIQRLFVAHSKAKGDKPERIMLCTYPFGKVSHTILKCSRLLLNWFLLSISEFKLNDDGNE